MNERLTGDIFSFFLKKFVINQDLIDGYKKCAYPDLALRITPHAEVQEHVFQVFMFFQDYGLFESLLETSDLEQEQRQRLKEEMEWRIKLYRREK